MASAKKTLLVAFVSTVLTAVVVSNAFYQKKQFYPSVVYLVRSSPSMGVLYIQGFVMVWVFGQILRKLLFGTLQAAEVEHMVEEFWYAVPETCLLFAAFREDFSPIFVGTLTLLFFFKAFHWLADVRIDFMERTPLITRTFHARATGMITLLVFCDAFLMGKCLSHMWVTGPSVQMVFALEYAILLLLALDITAKYILNSIDLQSENPWENKTVYMAYVEVVLGFLKVTSYFAFMVFMAKVHIFPLYITRRVFIATKKFKKSIQDVIMSRRAIYNLNNVYPDVTPAELERVDSICIVCREEMVTQCKRLPCGHIFHTACLRSWFQRQQLCPTCRSSLPSASTEQQMMRQQPQPPNMEPAQPQQQGQEGPLPQQYPGWVPPQPQAPPPVSGEEDGAAGQAQIDEGAEPVKSQEASGDSARPTPTTAPRPNPGQPLSFEEWLAAVGGGGAIPTPPIPTPQSVPQGPTPPIPFIPPFPPHFMPFGHASTNLHSLRLNCLSDEELHALEGTERENVEARIGVLRNIQLLLDSAVSQMNQYHAVTGQLPFQDSILLTDVGRSRKKQASSSGAGVSLPTPREGKKRAKESMGWEGDGRPPVHRSQSWVPTSTASSPSVFQSLLESKSEEDVQSPLPETEPLEPLPPQPPSRSLSSPAVTSDSELRQRRLEMLAHLKNTDSSNSNRQEKDKAPLLPTAADREQRRKSAGETDETQ